MEFHETVNYTAGEAIETCMCKAMLLEQKSMHGHFHLSIVYLEIQSTMELQDESEEARASSRLYVVTPLYTIHNYSLRS